jgi:hypothetical protein
MLWNPQNSKQTLRASSVLRQEAELESSRTLLVINSPTARNDPISCMEN